MGDSPQVKEEKKRKVRSARLAGDVCLTPAFAEGAQEARTGAWRPTSRNGTGDTSSLWAARDACSLRRGSRDPLDMEPSPTATTAAAAAGVSADRDAAARAIIEPPTVDVLGTCTRALGGACASPPAPRSVKRIPPASHERAVAARTCDTRRHARRWRWWRFGAEEFEAGEGEGGLGAAVGRVRWGRGWGWRVGEHERRDQGWAGIECEGGHRQRPSATCEEAAHGQYSVMYLSVPVTGVDLRLCDVQDVQAHRHGLDAPTQQPTPSA